MEETLQTFRGTGLVPPDRSLQEEMGSPIDKKHLATWIGKGVAPGCPNLLRFDQLISRPFNYWGSRRSGGLISLAGHKFSDHRL